MRGAARGGATRPIQHENECPLPDPASLHLKCFNIHLNFLAFVNGMEMRRRMVAVIHPNDDSVEPAQFWHCPVVTYEQSGWQLVFFRHSTYYAVFEEDMGAKFASNGGLMTRIAPNHCAGAPTVISLG
jgi:hypothetical protein